MVERYEIHLQGHLDASWSAWLGDMPMTHMADGTTVLVGEIADQAALHGLLAKIRDLGVPILMIVPHHHEQSGPLSG